MKALLPCLLPKILPNPAPAPPTGYCLSCARLSTLFCAALCLILYLPLTAQTPSHSTALTADLRKGEAALKAKDDASAAQYFADALKHDPANAEAHANLGAIDFFHGDCAAAEPHLRRALHANPALTKVEALLSVCERRQGEPSAQADMEHAFAHLQDPKLRTQIGTELANSYYQQGDLERTAAVLHTLLNQSPENVDILFFAQRVYSELADMTLNKLAVLSPHSARMEQLIAERLINAGDLKDAITHYRTALQLSPNLPGLHFELAESLLEGDPNQLAAQNEARTELQAAIAAEGDSARVESELGRIAALQGNTAGALSHYQQAFALDRSNVPAQMGLAEIYRQQNNPAEAARYLHMAVTDDPFNAEAHYKLSQVDRALHLDDEQKRELQLFLDIRVAKDKVKALYREMVPPAPAATTSTPQ